jgi:hypothetical protein
MPLRIYRCSWPQILNIDNIIISLSEESYPCNTEVDENVAINANACIEKPLSGESKSPCEGKAKIQSQAHNDTAVTRARSSWRLPVTR